MKNVILLGFITALFALFSCESSAQSPAAAKTEGAHVEVLDFHTTHRCKTCLTIENLTKELLAESYAEEMEAGLISFTLINADDEANEAVVQKYLAFGTTLIVNTVSDGQENHVDLTNFAFMNAGNKAKFKAGMKEQLDAALQKLKL